MRNLAFCVLLSVTAISAGAASIDCASENWMANPLAWRFDREGQTVQAHGFTSSLALYENGFNGKTFVRASVTPQRVSTTNDWATLGVALVDDERNFWHLALVQAPPGVHQKGHFFELCEMRRGKWLAQAEDGLRETVSRQSRVWEFGETLDLELESDAAGIRGRVFDAQGKVIWERGYAFPGAQGPDAEKAVRKGQVALHSTGGFKGLFKPLALTCSDQQTRSAADAFPAYASADFVQGVTDRATGFFRVVQHTDGRWWVIDPFGRGMILRGVDHVTYWGHYSERAKRSHHHEFNKVKFPDKRDWEADTLARLKKWGFNLLGAGCDGDLAHRGLVHTKFLSIGDGLCWDDSNADYFICPNEHRPCSAFPNVFHPDFPAWADYVARRDCAPNRNDPWLFGYFIDNELAWWGRGRMDTGLFDAVAQLPEKHTARIAQRKFLEARGVKGAVPDNVKLDFLKEAADIYFRVSSAAIRRHDPNHLVMGARFAGLYGAHPAVWEVAGKYCDLVTFNCYPWADLDRNAVFTDSGLSARRVSEAFAQQYAYVKRPMLITEWSFPALDSGLPCTGGAGQRFRTQALRTQATELFARTMLALPFLLGYDYFMWVDEPPEGISDAFPEDSNYGLINEKGEAYPEITQMFTRLHADIAKGRLPRMPEERPVQTSGRTADGFLRERNAVGTATYERTGERYVIRNAAGLELVGRVGGRRVFDEVKLNGKALGEYTIMWNEIRNGALGWHDIAQVMDVTWREKDGRGVLQVTGRGWSATNRSMELTQEITVFADRPWFLCDLVQAKNAGKEPLEIRAFYFREYAPYAADRLQTTNKSVPNLWKDTPHDCWLRTSDGAYFGAISSAPFVASINYILMNDGKSQHPDATFMPDRKLVLQPGETYDPQGRMWILAVGGEDGFAGWQRLVRGLERK